MALLAVGQEQKHPIHKDIKDSLNDPTNIRDKRAGDSRVRGSCRIDGSHCVSSGLECLLDNKSVLWIKIALCVIQEIKRRTILVHFI